MGTWRGEKFSGNSSRAKLAKIYYALIKCPIQYINQSSMHVFTVER